MELSHQRINVEVYSISFQNDLITGENDLTVFRGIVKKLYQEAKRAGYRNKYTVAERDFIKELYENCIGEDAGPNTQSLGNNLTYVPDEE